MSEQTVKCHICGEPYVFYAYYAGDQSACPSCRQRARDNMRRAQASRKDPDQVWPPDIAKYLWRM